MKRIISLIGLLVLTSGSITAQRIVERTITPDKGAEISLDFDFADSIDVQTWNKNEVYVKATVTINDNEDNDAFVLEVDDHGWYLEIASKIKDMDKLSRKGRTVIKKSSGDEVISRGRSVDLSLRFLVYTPESYDLEISTISGDILVRGRPGQLDLKTISGFIDLALPSRYQANIDMSTVTGSMYSGFTFDREKKDGMRHYGRRDYTASLNGGGTDLKLETISGDIFLREIK